MKHAIAIARRDLEDRRFIFFTAAVFAVIPFLAIALSGAKVHDPRTVAATTAGILAIALVPAIAIGLGATMIGSELSSGRLSFYFSKPVSPSALWLGKLVAALATAYASLVIVVGPSWVFSGEVWRQVWTSRAGLILLLVLAVPVLVLVAHAVSTILRVRTPFLLIDGAGLIVSLAALWLIFMPLWEAGATELFSRLQIGISAAILIVLATAGLWQLSRGRSDRRANHIELSKYLWSAIAGVLICAGGFVVWVVSIRPAEIDGADLYPAPNGSWIVVTGRAPHRLDYRPAYLVDTATGRFLRLPREDVHTFTFARNGRAVAWAHGGIVFHGGIVSQRGELLTRRLDPIGPIQGTDISVSGSAQIVLSDDASRLAWLDGRLVSVFDLAGHRSLGSVRLSEAGPSFEVSFYFVTPDVVRVYLQSSVPGESGVRELVTSISEFDVRTRTLRPTGEVRVKGRFLHIAVMPDGSRLFARTVAPADDRDRTFIADARTGERLTTLKDFPYPLPDGTMAMLTLRGKRTVWQRARSDGSVIAETDVGTAGFRSLAGVHGERAVLAVQEHSEGQVGKESWNAVVIDLARNAIERTVRGVRPGQRFHLYEDDPRILLPDGALFPAVDARGRIVRLDINTGAVTPLPH